MRTTDPVADVRTDAVDGAGSPATLAQALANRAVCEPDEVAYEFLLPDATVATTAGERVHDRGAVQLPSSVGVR